MKDIERNVLDGINEKILTNLESLEHMDKTSDDYANVIGNVNELLKAKKELTETANSEKWKAIRVGVDILTLGIPSVIKTLFINKGFKFEETGVYSSKTFAQVFKNI